MKKYDILVLGGGAAGVAAAEAARAAAPDLSICILSAERHLPYVRPMLTKLPMMHYRLEKTYIHPASWYREQRIELETGVFIEALDPAARQVRAGAEIFSYGACVYALGAFNFIPPFPGSDLPGVKDLRTCDDLAALRRLALTGKKAVVIGGGVIGLEAAYLLKDYGLQVTVLETAPYLMPRLLDQESSEVLRGRMKELTIHTNVKVLGISGTERAGAVEVEGLGAIEADLVVISCGVRANTKIAAAAGIRTERAVVVDDQMRTSAPGVFACGDCAQYEGVNTALWAQAVSEGSIAGRNAAQLVTGEESAAVYTGSESALLFTGPDFSLYADGDLGKDPQKCYERTASDHPVQEGFCVNRRPAGVYECRFYSQAHLCGVFLLGNLKDLEDRRRMLTGG